MCLRVGTVVTIRFSQHARSQMIERGITVENVEEALRRGAREFQPPNKLLFHFRFYCVVCRKIGEEYFVITVKPR